mgnify:CR=1 FL=1
MVEKKQDMKGTILSIIGAFVFTVIFMLFLIILRMFVGDIFTI